MDDEAFSRAESASELLGGSCLCGGVRFEVELPFRRANHCHCSLCRKHSGTFGLTQGRVPREQFRLLEGEELLQVFRPEGGTAVKVFCSVCGSSLLGGHWPAGEDVRRREVHPRLRLRDRGSASSSTAGDVLLAFVDSKPYESLGER